VVVGELATTRPFPYLSPDENRVLVAANADNGREIWLFELDNGTERQLTFDGLSWGIATWHPDGHRLISYTEPDYVAYEIAIDGSTPRRSLGEAILLHVSADGRELFYGKPQLERGFDFDVAVRPFGEELGEERVLVSSPAIEWMPVLSPDGRYLLYVSDESGKQELYATTYPGLTGRWQVSRGGGSWARWRGDGKEIYYTTHREVYAVSVDERDGLALGRPRKLFDRPSTDWSPSWPDGFDVTADGERFLILRPAPGEDDRQPAIVVVQNWHAEFAGQQR
jgi:Tol biopolymer transport system component